MAAEIMTLADELDKIHKYKIADQLRAAALSVSNNITEGSGSSSRKDFKLFLNYMHRSVFEVANIMTLCAHCGRISKEKGTEWDGELEEISRMIVGFSRSP